MLHFLFTFFKVSKTLKAHISGTEADINKQQKTLFSVFNGLSYQLIKEYKKILMHGHFNIFVLLIALYVLFNGTFLVLK